MRILGFYAIVFLTAGRGHYKSFGRPPVTCVAGDMLILFPEIAHAYGPGPGRCWDEYYVVFDGPVFDLWRSHGILSPERPVIRVADPERAESEIRGIVHEAAFHGGSAADRLHQICRLQVFLSQSMACAEASGQRPPEWLERATCALADPRSDLRQAARAAGHSYESLKKKFRALTGLSPAAWRDRQTMQNARRWIYEEGLTNKEIADRLGYCDEFHFSKRFREITGVSPSTIRASFRGRTQA